MTPTPETQAPTPPARHRRGGLRRAFWVALALVAIGGAAAVGTAYAQMHGGFGGRHGGGHERMEGGHRMGADFLAYRVDASAAQRRQIEAIAEAAHADLAEMHTQLPAAMQAFAAEIAKPAVDRQALEALRVQHLATAERASQRIVAAIADVAEVLTPEQRAKLVSDLQRFGPRHR